MKISNLNDSATQMIQSYHRSDNLNQPVDKKTGSVAAATEKVDISSRAKDINLAKTVIEKLPDIREAKVQELKTQIEQGSYKINSDQIAGKMVRESLLDIFG